MASKPPKNSNDDLELEFADVTPDSGYTEFITPPNNIKRKVGSGGLSEEILEKAQSVLESKSEDFKPLADLYIGQFDNSIRRFEKGRTDDQTFKEDITYYTIQLRAGAGMFHYTLVADMCSMLIHFLETRVGKVNDQAMDVIQAFYAAIKAISSSRISGNAGHKGQELLEALRKACEDYNKKSKK